MNGQISLFDFLDEPHADPGERTMDEARIGKMITWSELLANYINRPVWLKIIMESYAYYECVVPERYLIKQIKYFENGVEKLSDRVICYDGTRERRLINEYSCRSKYQYPESTMFYEIAGENNPVATD